MLLSSPFLPKVSCLFLLWVPYWDVFAAACDTNTAKWRQDCSGKFGFSVAAISPLKFCFPVSVNRLILHLNRYSEGNNRGQLPGSLWLATIQQRDAGLNGLDCKSDPAGLFVPMIICARKVCYYLTKRDLHY